MKLVRAECEECGDWVIATRWLGIRVQLERFGMPLDDAEVLRAYGAEVWRLMHTVNGIVAEPWDGLDRRFTLTLPHECGRAMWGGQLTEHLAAATVARRASRRAGVRVLAIADDSEPPY